MGLYMLAVFWWRWRSCWRWRYCSLITVIFYVPIIFTNNTVVSNHFNTVVSNHFHSVNILLFSSARSRDFDGLIGIELRCQCTQQKLQSICSVLTFDPQLKTILTFSVKDRYQLNYFICIKDFNAETNTSLKLNLFSFFTLRLSASSKENDLPLCIYFWY